MKRLIIHGDPGIRKNAIIEYDGDERVCFSISRQGDWHGPDDPQLWCVIGTEDEREDFAKRTYVPHWLETESIDAEAVEIIKRADEVAVS
ncbi:HAH_0734 family protein [Halorussus amylolyticus]|uniref:HAH_0734 family protein n=1 Tax=Halorussus amylolyticus TaxID=1126242 RepID=UPI0010439D66|nr:HAH_0734 family protein [Halorussus amylolyticus]